MYQVGDLIAYGGSGICRVTDINTRNVPGMKQNQLCYILEPLYQNCTISTPVEANQVFMRPVITKNEAEQLIDMIPTIQVKTYQDRTVNELGERYKQTLKQYSCLDLIKLTMSIYAKKQKSEGNKRKLGSVDEHYMKRAEDLLYGELAVALDIPKDEVPDYIRDRIGDKREDIGYADRE